MTDKKFYVYGHYDRHGTLRYIGKGSGNRAWTRNSRNQTWKHIFKEYFPDVQMLKLNLTEEEAWKFEKETIAKERKINNRIINICDGGIGGYSGENHPLYGTKRSQETIKRMLKTKTENDSFAKPWLGKKRDSETMAKLLAASSTPEAREKRRLSSIGRKHSEEHKRKIGEAHKNIERTQEWKDAISAGKKGRPNGLKGRVMPESHRKAISEATKGRRPLTPEEQAKRLATWKDRGGTSSKAKAVICIDTGVKYRCAKEAAEATKSDAKHIQACCVGRRKTHNKLTWKYA